jgi:hydroxymethylpyrimidine pyrophosphatase-like HAD family hydrolase
LISSGQSQTPSPPKALLIDLDGTVLPPDDQPTAVVIEAIKKASLLIPVGVASGRVQHEVGHYARMFGLTGPQVADNGATLLDPVTGRPLAWHSLNRGDAEHVISVLQPEAMRLLVCDEGRMVFDPAEISHWTVSIVIAEFPTHEEAVIWADRLQSDSVNAVVSLGNKDDWYVNCTKSGVDKGTGVRDFSHAVGVEPADLMVIGDGWNDLPMFRAAGHAVAMQGAPDELLALATAVVPNIENDGAAVAIEKYVLNA